MALAPTSSASPVLAHSLLRIGRDRAPLTFANSTRLLAKNSLPKMEHYLEARLWNDIFRMAQDYVGVPRGSIRATVLIETITASFQMDEIIYELREHSSGLNCGRWDYIFSFIKKMRMHPDFVLPDRSNVTMTVPFMDSYVRLLIKTCHKRGVAAIGGMAAQIPIKNDEAKNNAVMDKVRADKQRECDAGHDGTWVAHPGLVKIALDIFNKGMPGPNQYHIRREDVNVTRSTCSTPTCPAASRKTACAATAWRSCTTAPTGSPDSAASPSPT